MPTTTTGIATEFIQFTRTSNATVTDSDGLVKWAPNNLLLNSESFDTSSWTKTTTTVAANSIAAPNGTTTADTLTAAGANSTTLQSYTALAVPYTFGVWLRRKTGTGNIQIAADSGTYTTVTITSSWALYTVSQTPAAGTISAGIRIVTSADEVYAWGAALYRSDLSMQPNTSAYTLYNPTTPKNLLGYTESLTTGWTNSNTTDAIVSEINPVGLTGAVDVAATAGNGTLLSSLSLLASPYTFSIWLKRKTGSGTVEITVDGTTYVAAAVTAAWTRFSTTLTPSAGTKTPGIRLVTSGDAVYAWGAQLSDSASLDTYAPVYGAAVTSAEYYGPRRDFDGATLACKGLLVEEQRTNLALRSAEFDNAASWVPARATVTANAVNAPDGTLTADKLVEDTTAANSHRIRQDVTTTAIAYTYSVHCKAAERGYVALYNLTKASGQVFNLLTGAVGVSTGTAPTSATITAVGNGWYRCDITVTATAATNSWGIYIMESNSSTLSYNGDGTSGIYIWGAQLEEGSFHTSYIPTVSANATRTADVATVSTQAFPYSSTEGTYVANFQTLFDGTNSIATSILTVDNSITKLIAYIGSGANQVSSYDGATIITRAIDVTGTVSKAASAYSASGRALAVNGSAVATGTIASGYGTASTVNVGGNTSAGLVNGWVRQITYIPRRLSDAELTARSALT